MTPATWKALRKFVAREHIKADAASSQLARTPEGDMAVTERCVWWQVLREMDRLSPPRRPRARRTR